MRIPHKKVAECSPWLSWWLTQNGRTLEGLRAQRQPAPRGHTLQLFTQNSTPAGNPGHCSQVPNSPANCAKSLTSAPNSCRCKHINSPPPSKSALGEKGHSECSGPLSPFPPLEEGGGIAIQTGGGGVEGRVTPLNTLLAGTTAGCLLKLKGSLQSAFILQPFLLGPESEDGPGPALPCVVAAGT